MTREWVVVGISGATCSGKSTLAGNLHEMLPQSVLIRQDDYFLPVDSPAHIKVEALGHLNWEIMTALDMDSMRSDVHNILSQDPSLAKLPAKAQRSTNDGAGSIEAFPNLLILEGFLLLNDPALSSLCDLRYYLTLTREQCWERRQKRTYDPPDIPGYFDLTVWPEYEKHRNQVLGQSNIKFVDGMIQPDITRASVVNDILKLLQR
ncbi:nicotinamide riboside kinase 1 [Thrips palmi]|uniref:Nicotinamide riboside kinase 1 n=1 Tax=Thrips palmi TaxID=161013 RepID=A0A6P8ZVX6_THRPL|nr:nicotinamide riboside kinase 1 [Thrips palmi]